jgi:hypothetical protein
MTALILIFWALAVARLTRLVTRDKITEPGRQWLLGHLGTESQISYLVHCDWCTSIWVGFATAPIVFLATDWPWWLWPVAALGASQVTGLSATFESAANAVQGGE